MLKTKDHDETKRRRMTWCWVLIVVAIAGLSCSLATRTFRLTTTANTSFHSGEAQGMRQHLDRDAVRWVPPVPTLLGLQAPTFYPRIAPAGPPLPGLVLAEPLFNRPPPSLS